MDLHQLEYIIAIGQEQSISKAADKLFITQSALNQQLLRLENELGVPLFERRSRKMIPTLAGRIYLETSQNILDMKKVAYKKIQDISEEKAGEISVAYTPEAGSRMFSEVYPVFHRQYPDITFNIHEARVKKMEQLVLQKEVSFAFSSYYQYSRSYEFDYIDIDSEYMVLALPASHRLARLAGERSWETLPLIDLSLLRDDHFVLCGKETRMRDMADYSFSFAGFSPKILFDSVSTRTIVNMVRSQIAPGFIPQSYVRPDEPIVYFTVPPRLHWTRSVIFLPETYLTKPEKQFIVMAADWMRGMMPGTPAAAPRH